MSCLTKMLSKMYMNIEYFLKNVKKILLKREHCFAI